MGISRKINEFMQKGSWIRKMFEEGAKLKSLYGEENVFDFTIGNPTLPPPAEVIGALKSFINENPEGYHGYMGNAGYEDVRKKIAEYLNSLYKLGFEAKHIIMTTGAAGAMNVTLKSILNPGDEVIIISPYFVEYLFYIDNHGGKVKIVPSGKNFDIDVNAIKNEINNRTKAIIICSPNNPTGVVYSAESLESLGNVLLEKQKEFGRAIYLINDEPYRKIIYDGIDFPSHMLYYGNSILVTSHSKDFSLPGERIGYIGVHPELSDCDSLVDAMTFCNRVLGFVNAPAIWQRVAGQCQEASVDIEWYRVKRDIFYEGLKSIGYSLVKPQGAFYIFPEAPGGDDKKFVEAAREKNLLLVPGSGFGTPGYFRISFCAVTEETIKKSLPIFEALYREFSNG